VQSALSKVEGVVKAEVTMPDKATVTIQKGKVSTDKLLAAVKQAGYSAKLRTDGKDTK
jgi:copper chaperone CopZ